MGQAKEERKAFLSTRQPASHSMTRDCPRHSSQHSDKHHLIYHRRYSVSHLPVTVNPVAKTSWRAMIPTFSWLPQCRIASSFPLLPDRAPLTFHVAARAPAISSIIHLKALMLFTDSLYMSTGLSYLSLIKDVGQPKTSSSSYSTRLRVSGLTQQHYATRACPVSHHNNRCGEELGPYFLTRANSE